MSGAQQSKPPWYTQKATKESRVPGASTQHKRHDFWMKSGIMERMYVGAKKPELKPESQPHMSR